jgi:hypothetical protein
MATNLARTLGALAAMMLGVVATAGCGPSPEKAGDECDLDDGCPNQLVCAAGPDDTNICYEAPGASCTSGTDYCLGDAVCTDKKICEIPLGGKCETGKDFCQGDATCETGTCELPIGSPCDPAGKDYCVGDAVCGDTGDGKGTCGIAEGGACDPAKSECAGGLECAELQAGGHACYAPVMVTGKVFDAQTSAAIEGANVIALDAQGTAITDVGVSDASGNYTLDLPVPREADGAPVADMIFTLRASGSGYQTFPSGLRTALPIKTSEAKAAETPKGWTVQTTLTDVALLALPKEQQGLPSIAGSVVADAEKVGGVLVVAEDANGKGISAISDKSGAYTIFNVPDGTYSVHGYAAGLQLTPAPATMAGKALTGIDLDESKDALGKVTGSVSIVNAPGGSMTSVVLVVASTFSDTFVRGEVPRGLRSPLSGAPNVTGAFTIDDVPAGKYVVLAAFENDGLVRDPDPNIAGTQIVTIDVPSPGNTVALPSTFKITEALEVFSPGADDPEPVTSAPMLSWADDSSEDFYTVVVYDAYGNRVWCLSEQDAGCDGPNIPSQSGGAMVSVPYGGPMDPGMYYQFRATSWRAPGGKPGPISTTEDLRGVFYVAK